MRDTSVGVGERTWGAKVEALGLEAGEELEVEEEAITEYLT
jgi:hypothetical protein